MEFLAKGMDLILWWTYQRGDWWRGVITKRITFLGWMTLVITFTSGIFGTDVMNNALGFIFFLGGILLVVEIMSLFFRRQNARLDFKGVHTGVTSVGQSLNLPFTVHTVKPLKRVSFVLYPWTPSISYADFRTGREPREKTRNIVDRFFKFYRWRWLSQNKRKPFSVTHSGEWKGEAGELVLPVTFKKRGKWSLVNLRAHLLGVFGLFERSCKTKGERGEVYVAPEILPVRFIDGGGTGRLDEQSQETQPKAGESQEFLSLREYRPGDTWRKINWKAMARTDKAMIQEAEEPGVPTFLVYWDTSESAADEFELGASLATSLVTYFAGQGVKGGVTIKHGQEKYMTWEQGVKEILRCLASIQQSERWIEVGEEQITATEVIAIYSENTLAPQYTEAARQLIIAGDTVNGAVVKKEIMIA